MTSDMNSLFCILKKETELFLQLVTFTCECMMYVFSTPTPPPPLAAQPGLSFEYIFFYYSPHFSIKVIQHDHNESFQFFVTLYCMNCRSNMLHSFSCKYSMDGGIQLELCRGQSVKSLILYQKYLIYYIMYNIFFKFRDKPRKIQRWAQKIRNKPRKFRDKCRKIWK